MTDIMTPEERRRCMAAIKGKDTKPELIVRRYLFSRGLRYRVNDRKLPGSPDMVFKKYRTVIFIDGCFWHGHEGCRYFRLPKSNEEFWERKISRNRSRDMQNEEKLLSMGWRVLRVWECEVRKVAGREEYLNGLYDRIVRGFELERQEDWVSGQEEQEERMFGQASRDDMGAGQEYADFEEGIDMAAEDEMTYGSLRGDRDQA